MNLYLIRHASARHPNTVYHDDSERPLDDKGFLQSTTLLEYMRKMDVGFDYVCSSPYSRALQTAKPLKSITKNKQIITESLVSFDFRALIEELKSLKRAKTVAMVGHEPYMSSLASYILTGREHHLNIRFKKAAVMHLYGNLEKYFSLQSFVSYKDYKLLCGLSQDKVVN